MKIKRTNVKIARVSTVPYFVVTQLKQQLEYLATEAGMHVHIVTSPGNELNQFGKIPNLHVKKINIPRNISPHYDFKSLLQLFFFFRETKFDIVHSTTPKAGLLCALAGFAAAIPVRLHTFTGQPWIQLTGINRLLSIVSDHIIIKLNTRCYADSKSQAAFLERAKIAGKDKIHVLGNGSLAGVDLSRFDPYRWTQDELSIIKQDLGIPENSFVILFVGRITRDKGIFELIESFLMIARCRTDVYLLVIGPLDEEAGGKASISRNQLHCHPHIHYIGYRKNPEQYMALADVLCLPSYREGFGTVVIEAAAMGIPTVASKIYGLTDAVIDGITGLLVPCAEVTALTKALLQLIDDRKTCQNMGRNARKHAVKNFDAQRINSLLVHEYASLLNR